MFAAPTSSSSWCRSSSSPFPTASRRSARPSLRTGPRPSERAYDCAGWRSALSPKYISSDCDLHAVSHMHMTTIWDVCYIIHALTACIAMAVQSTAFKLPILLGCSLGWVSRCDLVMSCSCSTVNYIVAHSPCSTFPTTRIMLGKLCALQNCTTIIGAECTCRSFRTF